MQRPCSSARAGASTRWPGGSRRARCATGWSWRRATPASREALGPQGQLRADRGRRGRDELAAAAVAERADLVVCGPEAPLAAGLGDAFRAAGIRFFGPAQAAAEIEGSKAYAKQLMLEAGVPTAAFGSFDELAAAEAFIDAQPGRGRGQGRRAVRRARASWSTATTDEAKAAVRDMLARAALRRRRRAGGDRGAPHRAARSR